MFCAIQHQFFGSKLATSTAKCIFYGIQRTPTKPPPPHTIQYIIKPFLALSRHYHHQRNHNTKQTAKEPQKCQNITPTATPHHTPQFNPSPPPTTHATPQDHTPKTTTPTTPTPSPTTNCCLLLQIVLFLLYMNSLKSVTGLFSEP